MYKAGAPFTSQLEKQDPSAQYKGTGWEKYDAYQRQLKRFDIRVFGRESDCLQKFFATADSAALFPEYVARAVKQGAEEAKVLELISASRTNTNSMDYRTIVSLTGQEDSAVIVEEGGFLPETAIKLRENLVRLHKRGRMLCASYEALKFQRIDLFTVALRQIGACIAKAQLKDAVEVLINGDGNENPAQVIKTAKSGEVGYTDLLNLWNSFGDYEMNVLLASPDMMLKLLQIKELQDPATGLNFQGTGRLSTPLGAVLVKSSAVPEGTVVGLDRRFALETVTAGDVLVEYDKLIDCQLERAAVTAIAGFSKLFPEAVKVLKVLEEQAR